MGSPYKWARECRNLSLTNKQTHITQQQPFICLIDPNFIHIQLYSTALSVRVEIYCKKTFQTLNCSLFWPFPLPQYFVSPCPLSIHLLTSIFIYLSFPSLLLSFPSLLHPSPLIRQAMPGCGQTPLSALLPGNGLSSFSILSSGNGKDGSKNPPANISIFRCSNLPKTYHMYSKQAK